MEKCECKKFANANPEAAKKVTQSDRLRIVPASKLVECSQELGADLVPYAVNRAMIGLGLSPAAYPKNIDKAGLPNGPALQRMDLGSKTTTYSASSAVEVRLESSVFGFFRRLGS